ncbi:MAG: alpha-2-macroglobulin family protein, partial [Emcibacter sp.]|nr:alpha-2-macroglobulin family protein [Emcibacter sp.]
LGGYGFDIPISTSAIPGRYTVISTLIKSSQLGRVSFQVEDFVPQRIRARLKTDEKWLEANKKAEFTLKATFLYGPPATDLLSETHISLRNNSRLYADYSDFHFGLIEDDFYQKSLSPIEIKTDAAGQAIISVELTDIPDTSQPMLAYLQTSVFDVSGRPVNARIALPIRLRDVEVGLKKSFQSSLSEGDDAAFEVIALNKQGEPVTGRVIAYELVKEDYYYSWYRSGSLWNNRRNLTDTMVETGEVTTDKNGRAKIEHFTKDGRYRLNILDKNGTSAASLRYYVGWWSAGSLPNVPDELELSLKDTSTNDGETMTAFVKAPFAGKAIIMVMNDQLRLTRNISLPKQGREISIKVDKDWGPGAYLMVTAFRPEAAKPSKLPVRAMNLQWFSIDKDQRSTKVSIETPDTVIPRQTITLPVTLTGGNIEGKKMRLTIAAVDEGILGLTNFNSPNPLYHFLSKRRLGMTLADLYGRLIKPVDGLRGKLRTGGDAFSPMMKAEGALAKEKISDENATGVQTKTVKTVALYERDIQFDENGKGVISLDLPDFNGRLRLMVVAYGEDVVGQGSSELIVRDPVVADLLLPRFLSPGDVAETTLSIHNLSGKDRSFTVTLSEEAGLELSDDKSLTVTLEDGKRFEKAITLKASEIGDSKVALLVTSDGLADIKRHWDIAIRPAQAYVSKRQVSFLATGDHEVISVEDINGFLPSTVSVSMTLTDKPDFNVPDLLDSLYLYPYACGEQTTSRALPLLYYGDVANTWNKDYDPLKMRRIIDKAILHLLDLQKYDGSFALWRSTGDTHPWLTAYVFEFLSRAKEQNFDVPAAAYDHARSWLKEFINDNRGTTSPHVTAYAYYVLARVGDITPSIVRYFADTEGRLIKTRIGLGHLAAALNLIGEKALSDEYFEKAIKKTRPTGKNWHEFRDFGSDLRDGAALAALIAEASAGDVRQLRVAESLDREFDSRKYFSTQEQAWLLLATHSMSKGNSDGFQVALNQKDLPSSKEALRYRLKPQDVMTGFDIENIGRPPIRAIQSIRAVPSAPQSPASNGFQITRKILSLTGQPVDLKAIKQNDMMVVVIQGWSKNKIDHEALIVDLLPAGFEIENSAIGGYNSQDEMNFLPPKSYFLYEAARDDRYVAAMDLGSYNRKFTTSYIVRAVTPGTYVLPAVFVEDMYKPQYHARGAVSSVTITK